MVAKKLRRQNEMLREALERILRLSQDTESWTESRLWVNGICWEYLKAAQRVPDDETE